MKIFVFVRGVDSPFKRQVVSALISTFNPDINNVNAIKIAMADYLSAQEHSNEAPDFKAASKSCKRLVKTLLSGSHNERYIIIDNESLNPQDWESYIQLAVKMGTQMQAIGIDVSNEKFNDGLDSNKLNLQNKNLNTFILSCYKYYKINCSDDITKVSEQLTINFNI